MSIPASLVLNGYQGLMNGKGGVHHIYMQYTQYGNGLKLCMHVHVHRCSACMDASRYDGTNNNTHQGFIQDFGLGRGGGVKPTTNNGSVIVDGGGGGLT